MINEANWLQCVDPYQLLQFVEGKVGDRQLRLIAVAYCRRVSVLLDDHFDSRALHAAEQCADGLMTVEELFRLKKKLDFTFDYDRHQVHANKLGTVREAVSAAMFGAGLVMGWLNCEQTCNVAKWAANAIEIQGLGEAFREFEHEQQDDFLQEASLYILPEKAAQAGIVREVIGNPFRQVSFAQSWRTSEVMALAKESYL